MKQNILPLAAGILFSLTAQSAETINKPNIIVILADDMGFSDIGCYGSEIPTPNLDALAANGLRFTQFYNTGRCCPSRATLLTGLYAHQTGIGGMEADTKLPGYRGFLNDNCITIGQALQPAGYFTAMTGKWHVGQGKGVTPVKRGFDRCLNAPAGGFYYADGAEGKTKLFLNDTKIELNDERLPKNWYSTDLWTTFGLKFIDEAIAAKKPFYLHLCYNAPHFPLQAPGGDIAKFRGIYKSGWDAISKMRMEKQQKSGIIPKDFEKSPRPQKVSEWDKLSAEDKDRFDNIMAVYAACVYRLDKAVGDLVTGLKQRGEFDNTVILFMSDNGGNAESGPDGNNTGDPTSGKSNWFCGESWAYAENTPFRLFKHYNHEGGVSTPLIVHWPKGIAAKGELRTQPAHLIDIMATCVDLAGATYPIQLNGNQILPMEGCSLLGAFENKPIKRDALYWEHEGNAAIRVGDMKLVRLNGKPWELYNIVKDRSETHDLTASQTKLAKQLEEKWNVWANRAHVFPAPDKNGSEGKKGAKKMVKNQKNAAKATDTH